jgi:hypothetical protein
MASAVTRRRAERRFMTIPRPHYGSDVLLDGRTRNHQETGGVMTQTIHEVAIASLVIPSVSEGPGCVVARKFELRIENWELRIEDRSDGPRKRAMTQLQNRRAISPPSNRTAEEGGLNSPPILSSRRCIGEARDAVPHAAHSSAWSAACSSTSVVARSCLSGG